MDNFLPKINGKNSLLSIQHLFAMFGSTVLVPTIVGINPSVAICTAGIGTLAFHLVTKCKVPTFFRLKLYVYSSTYICSK